jgi:hypothetical protein
MAKFLLLEGIVVFINTVSGSPRLRTAQGDDEQGFY